MMNVSPRMMLQSPTRRMSVSGFQSRNSDGAKNRMRGSRITDAASQLLLAQILFPMVEELSQSWSFVPFEDRSLTRLRVDIEKSLSAVSAPSDRALRTW